MKLFVKKIEQQIMGAKSAEVMRVEKIRRQKRKRSKRSKEKVLADKAAQSEKKKLRGPVPENSEK